LNDDKRAKTSFFQKLTASSSRKIFILMKRNCLSTQSFNHALAAGFLVCVFFFVWLYALPQSFNRCGLHP